MANTGGYRSSQPRDSHGRWTSGGGGGFGSGATSPSTGGRGTISGYSAAAKNYTKATGIRENARLAKNETALKFGKSSTQYKQALSAFRKADRGEKAAREAADAAYNMLSEGQKKAAYKKFSSR